MPCRHTAAAIEANPLMSIMILGLDGYSEIGAHFCIEIGNLICVRYLFIQERPFFKRAERVLSSHLIYKYHECNMKLILDGNSDIGAHAWRNLCYLISLRHLMRLRAVKKSDFYL